MEVDPEARTIKYFNHENGRVFVHPSSTLFDAQTFPSNASFMAYFNKMETSKIFIRELTPFNAYVTMSRAPSRDAIRLLRDFDDRLFTTSPSEELAIEDRRLEELDELTKFNWENEHTFTVI